MVAYEHEAVDGVARQQADDARLQDLRRLVDNGQREVLDLQQPRLRLQHRGGGHDDGRAVDEGAGLVELLRIGEGRVEQVGTETLVAGGRIAQA